MSSATYHALPNGIRIPSWHVSPSSMSERIGPLDEEDALLRDYRSRSLVTTARSVPDDGRLKRYGTLVLTVTRFDAALSRV